MKNFRKIVACAIAMCTLSTVCVVNVSAEESTYATQIVKACEEDENNPDLIKVRTFTITCNFGTIVNSKSEEFIQFLKDAKPSYETDRYDGKNFKVVPVKIIGLDNDGNPVFSDFQYGRLDGFDENGKPIVSADDGIQGEAKVVGFVDGEILLGSDLNELVRFDENGIPEIVKYTYLENDTYKTIDVNTGEDILVKPTGDLTYDVIEKGDVTADTETDIRDITAFNQSIVKMNEIPDYLNSIADIDSDGEIGIKDLGLLKKFIVKTIDTL